MCCIIRHVELDNFAAFTVTNCLVSPAANGKSEEAASSKTLPDNQNYYFVTVGTGFAFIKSFANFIGIYLQRKTTAFNSSISLPELLVIRIVFELYRSARDRRLTDLLLSVRSTACWKWCCSTTRNGRRVGDVSPTASCNAAGRARGKTKLFVRL
jgi:hypothetical protein